MTGKERVNKVYLCSLINVILFTHKNDWESSGVLNRRILAPFHPLFFGVDNE